MSKELTQMRSERELKELRSLISELLSDEDWQIRLQAITRIVLSKKSTEFYSEAIPALITAINDSHNLVRQAAIPALGDIGATAKTSIPTLIEVLKNGSGSEIKAAVYSLGKIGPESSISTSVLLTLLEHCEEELEKAISWALGIIGPDTLEQLKKGTESEFSGVKRGCLAAIGNMGPVAVSGLPFLESALRDLDSTVRLEAAKAIGNLRAAPEVIKSIPALRDSLRDEDPDVRWTVAEALRKIGTEDAVDAWSKYETIDTVEARLKQLQNEDKAVRLSAAEALYTILNSDSEVDFRIINKALDDTYPKVPIALCVALPLMEESALPCVPKLLELAYSSDVRVRTAVITCIGKIGARDDETCLELQKLLEDKDKEVRLAAGLALELLDTPFAQKALKKFKWE